MNPTIFIRLIGALWFVLVAYLTVSAIGVKQETKGHLSQSLCLMFAIIAAFLLPHLPMFRFLNFAPVNPILSSVGVILCVAGMVFLVWGRQYLGKNWSQTVAVKEGHELVTSGPSAMCGIRCMPEVFSRALVPRLSLAAHGYFFCSFSVPFFSGGWAQRTSSWLNSFRMSILITRNERRR